MDIIVLGNILQYSVQPVQGGSCAYWSKRRTNLTCEEWEPLIDELWTNTSRSGEFSILVPDFLSAASDVMAVWTQGNRLWRCSDLRMKVELFWTWFVFCEPAYTMEKCLKLSAKTFLSALVTCFSYINNSKIREWFGSIVHRHSHPPIFS